MKIYCLHEGFYDSVQDRLDYLEQACLDQGVQFCPIDSLRVNYSCLPVIKPGDCLYNCARGSEALESLLLSKDVTTFYRSMPRFISIVETIDWAVLHDKAGLSSPRTIFSITDDRALLASYVDYLGGFPLVLKSRNGTRGIGCIKIESWPSLLSVVDYLISIRSRFVMRQFIENYGTARLVVLGDEVIASEFRENLLNDFRVSSHGPEVNYYAKDFSRDSQILAIEATRLANVETGGVDIIFDLEGKPYLLEINAPHNFVAPQQVTNVDIASLMIKWLRIKAESRPDAL